MTLANNEGASSGTMGTIRLLGVPVRFHFSFVLLIVFLVVMGLGGKQSYEMYALYVAGLFASVILHELGHAMAGKRYGVRTLEIVMYPIGGIARVERNPKPRQELWIALAGPLVNILIAGALFGYLYYSHGLLDIRGLFEPTDANLAGSIALGNLILAAFNFLPAFPMDGGRMLRSVLSRFKSEDEATRLAAWSGRMLAIGIGLYGLLSMQFMLVFIAFFVYVGAAQEGAAARGRTLTQGIPVRAAMMTEFHTLPHGSTIRDAANLLLATSQQDFPVVHGTSVIGLLARQRLLRALASQGQDAYVSGAMDRDFRRVPPDMDLADALPSMAQANSCALVMEDDRLLGLLTASNLSEFVLLRRFGMQPAGVPVRN